VTIVNFGFFCIFTALNSKPIMKKLFTHFAGLILLLSPASLFAGPGDTLGVSPDTEPRFAPNNTSYLLRYAGTDSGFVFGTLYSNINNWIGFAQAYTNFDTVEVIKILSFISYKAKGPANTPETRISYRLHKLSPTGAFSSPITGEQGQGPAAASLTLKEQTFESIDTSRSGGPSYNVIELDAPVKFNGENIVISVDCANLKAAGDTIGFLSDQPGSGLGLNYTFHWLLLQGAKYWFWSNPVFANQLNNNVAVFPVLKAKESDVSIDKMTHFQGIKAVLMPNPATDISILKFDVQYAGKYQIEIIANDGKLISSQELGHRGVGEHQAEINVSDLSAGSYLYSIINAEAGIRYTKTMVVTH
jgi:hypothetical protein